MVAKIKSLVFTEVKPGFFILAFPLESFNSKITAIGMDNGL